MRRYQEILNNKSFEYQTLSSLFHKKNNPDNQEQNLLMTDQEISDATAEIKKFVPSFEYFSLLARINDAINMISIYNQTSNNYENDVLKKFVNETYHIENEYVMQLNPHAFNVN